MVNGLLDRALEVVNFAEGPYDRDACKLQSQSAAMLTSDVAPRLACSAKLAYILLRTSESVLLSSLLAG